MLPELDVVLKYKHANVMRSYVRTFNTDEETTLELFNDMLRYLWLARKHAQDRLTHTQTMKRYNFN